MQIKAKVLSDAGWKDVVAKNKVKDNGVQKALERLKRVSDDDHGEVEKILDELAKLIAQLKKDKAVAAAQAVIKHLTEMMASVESTQREAAKAKAEHDKAQKAKAEAEKKAAAEAARKGDDEDEEEAGSDLLTEKLKPLLKMVAKGERMHALVAKSGKQVKVLLSRKPIPPARRKLLADELGGGSTKYYPGHCTLEAGVTTFTLAAEVAGLSKLVKLALLEQTGLRVNKLKCRGEDGDDDDEDSDAPAGGGAADEAEGEDDGAAAGSGDPHQEAIVAELAKAPEMWRGTRDLLQFNVDALRRAIEEQIADEADDFVEDVKAQLGQLDRVFQRLDQRLSDSLAKARDAGSDEERAGELGISRAIVADYLSYVKSEPLIRHLDANPFGVATNLEVTLTGSLQQLAKGLV
ncbi:MAG: hypothetical protein JNN18_21860 [Rubrivivax sp.]|jgi:hypothetical protein|nr:hypothetical protein [Rubrivivax sp.]